MLIPSQNHLHIRSRSATLHVMKHEIETISALIDLWHTTELGRKRKANIALGLDIGAPATAVRSMRHRNSIAKRYWNSLIEAAKRHAQDPLASPLFHHVNADLLVRLSTQPRSKCDHHRARSVPVLAA